MWNGQGYVPSKKQNQVKQVCDLDVLNKDALRQKMFKMWDSGIYSTVEKLVKDMEKSIDFEGSSRSMQSYMILQDIIESLLI